MRYFGWIIGVMMVALAGLLMFVNIPTQLYMLDRNLFAHSGLSSGAVIPIVGVLAPGVVLVGFMLVGFRRNWPLFRTILIALGSLVLLNLLILPFSLIYSTI